MRRRRLHAHPAQLGARLCRLGGLRMTLNEQAQDKYEIEHRCIPQPISARRAENGSPALPNVAIVTNAIGARR